MNTAYLSSLELNLRPCTRYSIHVAYPDLSLIKTILSFNFESCDSGEW